MKKLLILLLSICMIGSIGTFVSCKGSTETSSSTETVMDKVRTTAKNTVTFRVYAKYGEVPYTVTTYINESYSTENMYYVSGKYKIRDQYGDSYTGKYDLTIIYDLTTDECKVTKYDIQAAYQD